MTANEGMSQSAGFHKAWDKRIGGFQDDNIGGFQKTPDGGFILGGTSLSGISGDKTQNNWDPSFTASDFWLVRTDSMSNILWDRRFGGMNSEVMGEIILTATGGFICGGQSHSSVSGDKTQTNWDPTQQSADYWVVKTDGSGTKIWDKRFGGNSLEVFGSVKESPTGSIYVSGSSISPVSGDKSEANVGSWDFWVVKTNANGIKAWDRTFGGTGDDFAMSSVATSDGGVIVGGYSNSGVSGDKSQASQGTWDYWVIKIDSLGNKVWDKTFGGSAQDYLFSMCLTPDGGFISAGQSYSGVSGDKSEPNHDPSPAGSDYWILKSDGQGNIIWDRTYGASEVEQLSRIAPTADSGYILSGESYSPIDGDKTEANLGIEQTWVVKIDSVGNLLWEKTIFTTGHDELGTAVEVSPLCFVAVNYTAADTGGYKSQMSWGAGDYWMVKICQNDPSSIAEWAEAEHPLIYPNPAKEVIHVRVPPAIKNVAILRVEDITGRVILAKDVSSMDQDADINIDISSLLPGYYFITIASENGKLSSVPFVKG